MLTKAVSVALVALLALTSVSLTVHDVHAESQSTKPYQTQTSSKVKKKQSSKTQTKKAKKQPKKNTKANKQKQNRQTQATKQHQQNKSNSGKASKTANKQQKQVKQLSSPKVSTSPALSVDSKKQGQVKGQGKAKTSPKTLEVAKSPKEKQKKQLEIIEHKNINTDRYFTNRQFARAVYNNFGQWFEVPKPHRGWSLTGKMIDVAKNDPDRKAMLFTYYYTGSPLIEDDHRNIWVHPEKPFTRMDLAIFLSDIGPGSGVQFTMPDSFTYASVEMASSEMGMEYGTVERKINAAQKKYNTDKIQYLKSSINELEIGLAVMRDLGITDTNITNLDQPMTKAEIDKVIKIFKTDPRMKKIFLSDQKSYNFIEQEAVIMANLHFNRKSGKYYQG